MLVLVVVCSVLLLLKNVDVCAKCTESDRSATCEEVTNADSVSTKSYITKLEIRGNSSTPFDLNPETFKEFTNLENLKVEQFQLKKVLPDSFNQRYLKYLYLTHDQIEDIEPGAFRNLPKLDQIILDDNKLTTVRRGIFTNLSISVLTIFRNNIREFESNSIENVPNLEYLKLDNNLLEEFNFHEIIDHPESLRVIWIRRNKLKRLSKYMMQQLPNVEYLYLDGNDITKVEPGTFHETPNLITLDITNNDIKYLDSDVFPRSGFQRMEQFLLGHNDLMYLSPDMVFRLKGLKSIILMGNPWQCDCLSDIQSILFALGIKEKCVQDYAQNGRPVCINKYFKEKCPYTYDQGMVDKFKKVKDKFSYYIWQSECLNAA